jgi:hypothetical protein
LTDKAVVRDLQTPAFCLALNVKLPMENKKTLFFYIGKPYLIFFRNFAAWQKSIHKFWVVKMKL